MNPYGLTEQECRAVMCTAWATRMSVKAGLSLCPDHMLKAWSLIQAEIDKGGSPPEPTPKPKPKPDRDPGIVYYLRVGDLIKIGHTRQINSRLAVYPPKSELIAIRDGGRAFERAEHRRYAEHLEYGREWFTYSDALREDILRDDGTRPRHRIGEDQWFREGDDEDCRPLWQRHRARREAPVTYGRKVP